MKNNVALVYLEGVVKASGDIVGRGGELGVGYGPSTMN